VSGRVAQITGDRVASVLRIGSIVLRVDDLERQTEFWEAALGYERRDEESDDFTPQARHCSASTSTRRLRPRPKSR
jgi:catechol-2,3-dioxygenase